MAFLPYSMKHRNKLLDALRGLGITVCDQRYVPPCRRSQMPWRWRIRLASPTISQLKTTSYLVEGHGSDRDDARPFRAILKKICEDHGFSAFDIDSPHFGAVGFNQKYGSYFELNIDASDWQK